jgi:hypothetical protein
MGEELTRVMISRKRQKAKKTPKIMLAEVHLGRGRDAKGWRWRIATEAGATTMLYFMRYVPTMQYVLCTR